MSSSKAFWVQDLKAASLWEKLQALINKEILQGEPADFFLLLHKCREEIEYSSAPLDFFDYFEREFLFEKPNVRYFLLFQINSELANNSTEGKRLLFNELEELRQTEKVLISPEALKEIGETLPTVETPALTFQATAVQEEPETFKGLAGLTSNQVALLLHFALKNFGAENNATKAAKLAHLLTGRKFDNTGSSPFYESIRKAPESKGAEQTIKDLNTIKELFKAVGLGEIVKDIEAAEKTVKNGKVEA